MNSTNGKRINLADTELSAPKWGASRKGESSVPAVIITAGCNGHTSEQKTNAKTNTPLENAGVAFVI